jgi:hypothetical protein
MFCLISSAYADLADKLSALVGFTIIDSKTIMGWYDEDGKEGRAFNGCKHDRVIIFTDNKALTCAEYGYQYAYRPAAVILGRKISYQDKTFSVIKMVVEDEIYDMR